MRRGRRSSAAAVAVCILTWAMVAPDTAAAAATLLTGWGRNLSGQVGDSTWTNRSTPVQVCAVGATECTADPLSGATAVAGGGYHSLALLSDGSVLAWGANDRGQLGDNSTTYQNTPVHVCGVGATDCTANPLKGVTAIAAGEAFSLALLGDGTVVGWGRNLYGQLGNGSRTDRLTPVQVCAIGAVDCTVGELSGVKAIATGNYHSLALLMDGTVVAWGDNLSGQLGDGSTSTRSTPVRVCATDATDCTTSPLSGVETIAAGNYHSLVSTSRGRVLAWGFNGNGQLGDGTRIKRSTPVQVCAIGATACAETPLTKVVKVVANPAAGHSHALQSGGGVVSWGFNGNGELGDRTTADRLTPVRMCAVDATDCTTNPLTGIRTLASGGQFGVALTQESTMVAWGANFDGMLGDGTTERRLAPVRVCAVGATNCTTHPLTGVTAVAAGRYHSLGVQQGVS